MHDIRAAVSRSRPTSIFHLAAQADVGTSVSEPGFDAEVNVVGTVNTLEAARAARRRRSSSRPPAERSTATSSAPATEDDAAAAAVSPYGIAKLAGEEYLAGWNRVYGTRHVVLRFANVYGPRQSPALEGGVVAIFLERLAGGEETSIFGDGEQTRDYVYVGDVVGRPSRRPGGRRGLQRRHRRSRRR